MFKDLLNGVLNGSPRLLCLALAASAMPARAANITWAGPATGGSWGVAANWNLGRAPLPGDNAINVAGETPIVRTPQFVGGLSFAGGLTMAGFGDLSVGQAGSFIRQNLTIAGGTLFVDRSLDVGDAATGFGLRWTSGSGELRGAGIITLLGASTISGNNRPKTLATRLEIANTLTWSGVSLFLDPAGRDPIYIKPLGRWVDMGDRDHAIYGGIGGGFGVQNSGTYAKLGAGTTTILNFDNPGRIDVTAGELRIANLRNFRVADQALAGGVFAVNGARLQIGVGAGNAIAENAATVILSNGGQLMANGGAALGALTRNTGTLQLIGATALATTKDLSNSGSLLITTGSSLTTPGNFTNDGTGDTRLALGQLQAKTITVTGGSISGVGLLRTPGKVQLLAGAIVPGGVGGFGVLDIAGAYEQTGGQLAIEIGGRAAGQADRLAVTGRADLGGQLLVDFQFRPALLDSFLVLSSNGPLSIFQSEVITGLPGDLEGRVRYFDGSVFVDIVSAVPVPEPPAVALWLAGLGVLAFSARRRRVTA